MASVLLGFVALVVGSAGPPGGAVELRDCKVGERVSYPVPDPRGTFVAGCARLEISGKTVQFNAQRSSPVGGRRIFCIGLAPGRGPLASYLSEICPNDEPPRFAVLGKNVPRPDSDDDGYFIWGTAPAGVSEIEVRWIKRRAPAAVFNIGHGFAQRFGAAVPFSIFIVELPREAACASLTIATAEGERTDEGAADRVCARLRA